MVDYWDVEVKRPSRWSQRSHSYRNLTYKYSREGDDWIWDCLLRLCILLSKIYFFSLHNSLCSVYNNWSRKSMIKPSFENNDVCEKNSSFTTMSLTLFLAVCRTHVIHKLSLMASLSVSSCTCSPVFGMSWVGFPSMIPCFTILSCWVFHLYHNDVCSR